MHRNCTRQTKVGDLIRETLDTDRILVTKYLGERSANELVKVIATPYLVAEYIALNSPTPLAPRLNLESRC